MEYKNTLVVGASPRGYRYSHKAISRLRAAGHPVVGLGTHAGTVADITIETQWDLWQNIHTVTLYINPTHQPEYYKPILSLHPKRVIFNPGTENPDFEKLLKENNIEVLNACTLVLLSIGQY